MFPFGHGRFAAPLRPRVLSAVLSVGLPLAGAAAAAAQSGDAALLEDARLEKKVTLKLKKTPLSEVTAELGRLAGVTLKVTPDTADEPAVVHVTDQPAREVMRQLARLFDYRWARSGKAGEYRYELLQDLNAKRAEEALRQQDRFRALKALQADLVKRLELFRERPNPRQEATLRVALALTPAHWEALASGRALSFSTRQEPGAVLLPPALAGEVLRLHQQSGGNVVEAVRERLWLSFPQSRAHLQHSGSITEAGGPGGVNGGMVGSALSPPPVAAAAVSPDQEAAWQRDPVLGARRPFGVDPVKAAPGRRFTPGRPTFLHLYEILPGLAEAYGIDVVADAYRTQRFSRQPPSAPQEAALYEALNRCLEHAADWTRDGEFIRARSRTWYHDRPAEIPLRLVRHWSAHLRRQARMTLDDAATAAMTLRDEQWPYFAAALQDDGVYLHGGGIRAGGLNEEGSREILRAWGTLQPRQKELLRSGGRVALAEMPPAPRRWLLAALDQQQRRFATAQALPGEVPPGVLSLSAVTVRREITAVEEGQVRWILRVVDGPNAGKQMSSTSFGGTLPPGLSQGGQVFEQLAWRYQYAAMGTLTLRLDLPWVYVDPSVKQPATAEKATPAPNESRPDQ